MRLCASQSISDFTPSLSPEGASCFFILPAASVTGGAILPHTTCLGTRLGTSRGTPWHPIFRVSAVDFAKPFILFWAPQHKISGFRA